MSVMAPLAPFRSMIFLAGTPEELRNYLKTVEIFDVDWLAGMMWFEGSWKEF